jgi:hypothetical protein
MIGARYSLPSGIARPHVVEDMTYMRAAVLQEGIEEPWPERIEHAKKSLPDNQ